jgi:DNA-binding transcriptional regulator YhcF (GntR family)
MLVWSGLVCKTSNKILFLPNLKPNFIMSSYNFSIKKNASKPKYLQLAEAIVQEIKQGNWDLNQRLPSVNKLSKELKISRETVFKALNHLSERGIVKSANRQGYYVAKTDIRSSMRILFLLDKFTTFKEDLYHSFMDGIGENGEVEVFFHHHNLSVFRSLIVNNLSHYTHFVLLTFMREDIKDIVNLIPAKKRIIIDSYEPNLEGEYSMIFQDFATDIYNALNEAKSRLKKYKRILLVAPGSLYHANWIRKGFHRFIKKNEVSAKIINGVDATDFKKGDVYITLSGYDIELVEVIKLSKKHHFKIGKDIGIISYNDTPIKEVLEDGITVISTDFKYMGKKAAEILLDESTVVMSNPTQVIFRNSL